MTLPFKHPQPKAGLDAITALWRDLRTAAAFLTRLPVGPSPLPEDTARLGYLSRSMAMFPLVGAGVGIGTIFGNYLQGALRNPSAAPIQFANLLLGFALAEATGLFGLVVALIILFVF